MVLLTACGPSDEEARKAGFVTAKEMVAATKLGLKNHEEYAAYIEKNEAEKLGFDSVLEMRKLQSQGYQSKALYLEAVAAKKGGFTSVEDYRLALRDGFDNFNDWRAYKYQGEMEGDFLAIKREYGTASSQENYYLTDTIKKQFRVQLASIFPLNVKSWKCNVVKIYSDRSIFCSSNSVTYHIELNVPSPTLVVNLHAGQAIRFSGTLTRELSITDAGAVDNPEISVEGASIY